MVGCEGRVKVLGGRDVDVAVPHCFEAGEEGGFEFGGVGLFDVC
jgi:hypothetical protein